MVAGHGEEDVSPNEKLGFGFICDTYFDALCLKIKEKERHTLINIVQKASTPISKINGKTSQSKFSNLSASTLELCCSNNSCTLLSLSSSHFRMLGKYLGGNC